MKINFADLAALEKMEQGKSGSVTFTFVAFFPGVSVLRIAVFVVF